MLKKYLNVSDKEITPIKLIVLSFIFVILVGTFLLMLPIASKSGHYTSFIDALFTSTSATCVTGLVVFDTYNYWSNFGQFIILLLIQIGGLGLLTLTTFFTSFFSKKLGFKTLQLAQESINLNSIGDISNVIKKVVVFSISFELIGAILLSFVFIPEYGIKGIYISIFLAISSFCNAGFDILGFKGQFSSLSSYYDNPIVIFTISILIIIGGVGFIVWNDIYNYKKNKKLLLHTKVVFISTVSLIFLGTIIFYTTEFNNNKTIGDFNIFDKFMNSFFHSVSTRTAGFNTINMNDLTSISKLFSIIFMFIGAAPGSTGGGIKVTTFYVLFMTVVSVIKADNQTVVLGRRVNKHTVYRAISTFSTALVIISIVFFILYYTNAYSITITPINYLFETVSAFATVGLSSGITTFLENHNKLLLVVTMFIGRVGCLSIFIAIFKKSNYNKNVRKINPEGIIIVG